MAKKIRFPFEMKNGVKVNTVKELREHFYLPQLKIYFLDGKLETWLRDRYEMDLADAVEKLDRDDDALGQKICAIFEIEYSSDMELQSESQSEIPEEDNVEQLEDEYISSILQIEAGEIKRFENKNIHISAYINCKGALEFEHCHIFYNESESAHEISMEKGSRISICNSVVTCMGFDKNFFISGTYDMKLELTKFEDCSYFARSENSDTFFMSGCSLINCAHRFLYLSVSVDCNIQNNEITQKNLKEFNVQESQIEMISLRGDDAVQGVFSNNRITEKESKNESLKSKASVHRGKKYIHFESSNILISNCTFIGLANVIEAAKIENCRFEHCTEVIDTQCWNFNNKSYIKNCVFENCFEVIQPGEGTKISNCQFVLCRGCLIASFRDDGIVVEYCEFTNVENTWNSLGNTDGSSVATSVMMDMMATLLKMPELRQNGSASISFFRRASGKPNYIKKCIFNGININEGYLIEGHVNENIKKPVAYIEDCSFSNCATKRKDNAIIKTTGTYYKGIGNKPHYLKTVIVKNCKGLDKINKESECLEN